jgi:uncharacterized membrane protein
MKKNIKDMTWASMFIALIALLGFVPNIGLIRIGFAAITILHIPVILGSVILGKYRYALAFGLSFGLVSLIVNSYTPSLSQALFINPLVSVVPRMFVGLAALGAHNLILKLAKNGIAAMVAAAIAGTLTNTVLVLSAMGIVGGSTFSQGLLKILTVIAGTNGSLEIAAAIFAVPIIGKAVLLYKHNG